MRDERRAELAKICFYGYSYARYEGAVFGRDGRRQQKR